MTRPVQPGTPEPPHRLRYSFAGIMEVIDSPVACERRIYNIDIRKGFFGCITLVTFLIRSSLQPLLASIHGASGCRETAKGPAPGLDSRLGSLVQR